MSNAINAVLIAGFIVLDWLRFHDMLKPEPLTVADWLTGALSLLVLYVAAKSLLDMKAALKTAQ